MSFKFDIETVQSLMQQPAALRNLTVIAHVDHGKSTLTDSLVRMAGISTKERFTDATEEEQKRGISIEACGVSLPFELPSGCSPPPDSPSNQFLINLIDSPGHVDFSSEVTTALRLTDGAIVVVDAVEGVCVQTETVLRQALLERIKPVLVINKIDRLILELKLQPEEIYMKVSSVIESVNVLISTYTTEGEFEELRIHPLKGNVMFASAIQGWGFTIESFSRILAPKLKVTNVNKFKENMWGDHFYDASNDKWLKEAAAGAERGFCRFMIKPFCTILNALLKEEKAKAIDLLSKMSIKLTSDEQEKLPIKQLMKVAMSKLSPLGPALVEMVILKLPSPLISQKLKVPNIYEGNLDDTNETAVAMKACSKDGPLMVYISKMLKTNDNRFVGYGRIFSGTLKAGNKVNVVFLDDWGKKTIVENIGIRNITISMGRYFESISLAQSGNLVCIDGVDKYLTKSGSLTTNSKDPQTGDLPVFREMSFAVSPVVKTAVRCENPTDIPVLVEGLKKLVKADSCVEVRTEETGESVIGAAGELHLEILLKKLRAFAKDIPIVASEPIVTFNETVSDESHLTCTAKSANKHNKLWMKATKMNENLVSDIMKNQVNLKGIVRGTITNKAELASKYGMDQNEIKKIWAFGPEDEDMITGNRTNMLLDSTRGAQYLNEVEDHIVAGFRMCTKEGALCSEKVRNTRFNLLDVSLHTDSVHRGPNQMIPLTRRVMYASQLSAKPRLVEPWYQIEIQCDQTSIGTVYSVLEKRRGKIEVMENREGTPLYICKGFLPVIDSFKFAEELRSETGGKAFPQCSFSHWQTMDSDPLDSSARANGLVKKTRERKGMNVEIPPWTEFYDKL